MVSFSFTSIEIRDILVSVLALSVIFAYPQFLAEPASFLVYLLVVAVAFMGHELSHKFTAIRLGYFSEYRMWPQGLLLALFMALATGGRILFAAPGAVYFASRWMFQSSPTRSDVGKIGASGPLFNIIAGAASVAALFSPGLGFLYFLALINLWLAIFNMIPFGPLDGAKVFRWKPVVWAAMMASAVAIYVVLLQL
jgi:Zn-dependent protease